MEFICAYCGKMTDRPAGHVNRSRAQGMKLFCGRTCAGLHRRKNKSINQKKAEKRLYDAEYRKKNRAMLKAKKAAYFKRTYDPAQAAIARKKNMPRHIKYCRQPKYKQWKREYDRRYRAAEYGPFAQAYLLAIDLNRAIKSRSTNYEIRKENQTLNKRQARRREAAEHPGRYRTTEGIGLA